MTPLPLILTLLAQSESATKSSTPAVDDDAFALETIVRSSRREERLADLPFAITVLEEEAIADGRPAQNLGEALNQTPGVLVTSEFNASQDLRISVRGFGARSPFGVRGVRVYLDGVPLTVPDGSSALDVVDPALVKRIEVLRGPAAALYGSAASAVILIETRLGGETAPLSLAGSGGMNGLLRGSARASGAREGSDWLLGVSSSEWLGEREQSAQRSTTAISRVQFDTGPRSSLTLSVLGHDGPRARDPGGLTAEELERDRRAAGPINLRFRTGEQVRQGQVGLLHRYVGERLYTVAEGHGWTRQFRSRVPFRAVELERWVGGGRFAIGYDHGPWQLESGLETEAQRDRRRNYGNDDGVVTDEVLLRQDENLSTFAWTAQGEWRSPERALRVRAATRVDRYAYALRDRLLEDGDGSGERAFTVGTALVGVVYRPTPTFDLFANSSVAYDVPTLGELAESTTSGAAPVAGLDPELAQSRIHSTEIGARGRLGPLSVDGALFYARSSNEIVSEETELGLTVFRNSGRSDRAGAELGLSTAWGDLALTAQGSYLWSEVDGTGRAIPGAPEWLTYGQLRYGADFGWFSAYEIRGRGPVELGPMRSDFDWLSHVRSGYRVKGRSSTLTVTAGIRNVFDAEAIDNFRPNAFGERFFEPAPGRWFYLNVAVELGG